jgi:DNA-binding NarL/FixJ family response regulator
MRVILADDQAQVRSALRLLLEHQPGLEILGEAVDTKSLLDRTKAACPDLVLLDWELPGLEAQDLLSALHDLCPNLAVIALSAQPEKCHQALGAGADEFASKGDPPEQLLAAVKRVGTAGTGCPRQRNDEIAKCRVI